MKKINAFRPAPSNSCCSTSSFEVCVNILCFWIYCQLSGYRSATSWKGFGKREGISLAIVLRFVEARCAYHKQWLNRIAKIVRCSIYFPQARVCGNRWALAAKYIPFSRWLASWSWWYLWILLSQPLWCYLPRLPRIPSQWTHRRWRPGRLWVRTSYSCLTCCTKMRSINLLVVFKRQRTSLRKISETFYVFQVMLEW